MSIIERAIDLQKELDTSKKEFQKLKKLLSELPIEKIIKYMSDYSENLKMLQSSVGNPDNRIHYFDGGIYIVVYKEYLEKYRTEVSKFMKYIKSIIEKAEKLESRADEEIAIRENNGVIEEEWENVKNKAEKVKTYLQAIYKETEAILEQIQNCPDPEKEEEELKRLCYQEQTKVRTKDMVKKTPFWVYGRFMEHVEDFTAGRISHKIFWNDELWIKRRLAEFGIKEEERYFDNFDMDEPKDDMRAADIGVIARKYPTLFPGWYNDKGEFLWDLYWEKIENSSKKDRLKRAVKDIVKRVVKRVKKKTSGLKAEKQNSSR